MSATTICASSWILAHLPPAQDAASVPWRALVPAFIVGELRRAFEMGFLLFLPFLIIDIVVASVLMSLGMMMLPPSAVSLPFKLIFFVLIDGWRLVAGSLIQSFVSRLILSNRDECATKCRLPYRVSPDLDLSARKPLMVCAIWRT